MRRFAAAPVIGVALLPLFSPVVAHHGETPASAHCRVITHRGLAADGTENQPRGVSRGGRWGFAEVDADLSSDEQVVAVHDSRLGRTTDGYLWGYVNTYAYAEMTAPEVPRPIGTIRLTTTLIERAIVRDVPLMVTMNRHGRHTPAQRAHLVDTLYAAVQAHPHPHLVFFGGAGYRALMAQRHPDASTFYRYVKTDTRRVIRRHARREGIDLVGLPVSHYAPRLVRWLRAEGIRVATRQVRGRKNARLAQAAGIRLIQGNRPDRIATRWCR